MMQIWKNYIEELHSTNSKKNGKIMEEILIGNDEKGPMISRSEIDWAIRYVRKKRLRAMTYQLSCRKHWVKRGRRSCGTCAV